MKNVIASNSKIERKNITAFDIFEEGKRLFANDQLFEGFIFIRENIDKSDATNEDIKRLLMGEISIIFFDSNLFDFIERPDFSQLSSIQKLKEKYSKLIKVEDQHFEILKSVSYDFFESISPRKFQKNIVHSSSMIKGFMFDVNGDDFIIIEDKLHFIKRKEVKGYNPFL